MNGDDGNISSPRNRNLLYPTLHLDTIRDGLKEEDDGIGVFKKIKKKNRMPCHRYTEICIVRGTSN